MRKFTKLINESKKEEFRQHPLMNPVDWDEVFKPLIDHIEGNFDVPSPGETVFSKLTMKRLASLMVSVNRDYEEYWLNVIDDGSQDIFLQTFKIDLNWDKFVDITRVIEDNCTNVEESSNYRSGKIDVKFSDFNYKSIDDLSEDIKDVCGKMKMFPKVNYDIFLFFQDKYFQDTVIIRDGDIIEDHINSSNSPLSNLDKKLLSMSSDINNLNEIKITIYNKETTGDNFIPRKYLDSDKAGIFGKGI
jgi:hypothetical protein